MSRSRKHSPAGGMCGGSEKWDKRHWHRNYRALTKRLARAGADEHEAFAQHGRRLVSDTWSMKKDGKQYWPQAPAKFFRK